MSPSSLSQTSFIQPMLQPAQHVPSRSTTSLHMMFDQLSSAISEVAKNFGPKRRISEKSIQSALRQVRRALLDADVNVDVADTLVEGVRTRSLGTEVLEGVTADQQFIKAVSGQCCFLCHNTRE